MANKIKKILVSMLEPDTDGLSEFDKLLKAEKDGRERNNILHDKDGATFMKQFGVPQTPIIPVIMELRSVMVMKTILMRLL